MNRHLLIPYFYFLIIYFIFRKARKGAIPLFFTTLEETKKHQIMDEVLIHEKMKIWFPKSNFYPEASGQAIGCFTFNILHFLLSHNTKMLFMNSSIQYHLSKIPFNLLIYILKWRCSALYTRFFIGYWINTGCDFYHGPFFMAPLNPPKRGKLIVLCLDKPRMHEFDLPQRREYVEFSLRLY